MGYFAPDDYTALKNLTKTEKTLLDQNIYNSWDGKTLTIDTENLNLKSIEEAIKTKSSKEEAEKILKQSQNQDDEKKQASKKTVETKKKDIKKTTSKTKPPAKKTKKVSKK